MARRDLADKVETRLSPLGAVSEETMVSDSGHKVAESLAAPMEALMEEVPEDGPSDRMEETSQFLEEASEAVANPTPVAGAIETTTLSEPEDAAGRSATTSNARAGDVLEPVEHSERGEQPPTPVPGTSKDADG